MAPHFCTCPNLGLGFRTDESFEFVDAIEDESTDYVIPTVTGSVAVREIFGNEILVDENRPDHSLLVSSLDNYSSYTHYYYFELLKNG
jgi:hypothetical protein